MAKKGRPRANWQQLKNAGSKVWKQRKVEQLAEEAPKAAIISFVKAFAEEEKTFLELCTPGTVLCSELDGSEFHWPENNYLTICRDYAQNNIDGAAPEKSWTLKLSKRFLSHFTSAKAVIDPVAANNIKLMCAAFPDPTKPMNYLRLLALVEFWAVKKRKNGKYVLKDEELLNFHPSDLKMQDQAILAIRERTDQ
jgi:hypothetical protein